MIMLREERRELESRELEGLGWREAYGVTSEAAAPYYIIWWRFELAGIRRWRES